MRYRLTIGINTYYLSEADKEFYLNAINQGQQFIQLKNGLVLSRQFMDLAPLSEIEKTKEIDLKLDEGRWECPFGKWHYNGSECSCDNQGFLPEGELDETPRYTDEEKSLLIERSKLVAQGYKPDEISRIENRKTLTAEEEKTRKEFLMQQAEELKEQGL